MASFDLLGRRWTLRIVCELASGTLRFTELRRRVDGMSTSVLAVRLRELSDALLVEQEATGKYQLTDLGYSLTHSLAPLFAWSDEWAAAMGESHND